MGSRRQSGLGCPRAKPQKGSGLSLGSRFNPLNPYVVGQRRQGFVRTWQSQVSDRRQVLPQAIGQ